MSAPDRTALVGVVMGSDSDWPTMSAAAEALAEFEVRFEVGVVSAHRTPQRMLDYARSAVSRGIQVIIAGAGGAAHMPGMVASATPLPVIGVMSPHHGHEVVHLHHALLGEEPADQDVGVSEVELVGAGVSVGRLQPPRSAGLGVQESGENAW